MSIFNIENFLRDTNSNRICELHLTERQLPYAGYLVNNAVHELKPLQEFDALTHDTCKDIVKELERLFNIFVDKDTFTLQKDGLIFIVVSGKAAEGINITLRKSLDKNVWL